MILYCRNNYSLKSSRYLERNLFILRKLLNIMPSRYLDKGAETALHEVITKYKEKTGIEITRSQAVLVLYAAWIMPVPETKIRMPEGSLEALQRR
jgi:hypothetical protein